MKIAVLSGKGGTGKTFISVNLAYVKGKSLYVDCDVEEPNGKLFLKPQNQLNENINVMVPTVDTEKCTGCRKCVDFCKFNALAYIKNKLLIFPELCHACKGCVRLCPENALQESYRNIGHIEYGITNDIEVRTGVLNTGESTGIPIIRKLLSDIPGDRMVVVDCPPGSACSVMESIRDADFCLLVAEPTRFGIHNLNMVYNLVKLFNKPHAIVINKDMGKKGLLEEYCRDRNIKVLASIPYDSEVGLANSEGIIASAQFSKYFNLFRNLIEKIEKEVPDEATGDIKW